MSMEKKVQAKHISDREILEKIQSSGGGMSILAQFADFPVKVVMAKLLKLRNQGLTDFGVSAARPWLTSEGRKRLVDLGWHGAP